MADEDLSGAALDDEEEARFVHLNERARMLGERALYHNDSDATRELQLLFSPLILRMKYSVGRRDQDDLVSALTETTMRALKQAIDKRVDRPLAYTLRALRNEYSHSQSRLDRRNRRESALPEGYDVIDDRPAAPGGDRDGDREQVLRRISEYRARAKSDGKSKLDVLMADVMKLCYLKQISPAEAYALLGLTPRERASLNERLSRGRHTPGSPLDQLGNQIRRIIGGLLDDETPTRRRDNTQPLRPDHERGDNVEDGT